MNHRLDKALHTWAEFFARHIDEALQVGEPESRLINESELSPLTEQAFLCCSFRHEAHSDGDWQMLLSVDEAELLERLEAMAASQATVASKLEQTCEDWVYWLTDQRGTLEVPRYLGLSELTPEFRSNLKIQICLPLLVEGETFFEVKVLVEPSLYESLSQNGVTPGRTGPTAGPTDSVFGPMIRPSVPASGAHNLGVVLDVPLELTVVLGTTSVSLEDLVALAEGSVLELDKLAGEPVELYVKDRLVGIAEVVVSDERFAVRILEMFDTPRRYRPSPIHGAA